MAHSSGNVTIKRLALACLVAVIVMYILVLAPSPSDAAVKTNAAGIASLSGALGPARLRLGRLPDSHGHLDPGPVAVRDEILQKKANTFGPTTQSRWHCYMLSPTPVADVLGEALGTSSYCVLHDVCIHGSSAEHYLFDDVRAGNTYDFPRQVHQRPFTTFLKSDSPKLRDAVSAGDYYEGDLAVAIQTSYCCSHIRHFLEPIPTLNSALLDLRTNASRRAEAGLGNISGTALVSRAVLVGGPTRSGDLGPFNEWMLHAGAGGKDHPEFTFKHGVSDIRKRTEPMCFKRLLVPGSNYLVYQSNKMADDFRDAVYARLSVEKRKHYASTNDGFYIRNEGPSGFQKANERVILYSVRGGRRTVSDSDIVVDYLNQFAARHNAVVKVIEFGNHAFLSQAAHAQEADIFIGIHGGDLTNLLFQRKGAGTIELNPLFFFESGYREMAVFSGLHYTAWTCTAPSCAFGGNRDQWNDIVGSHKDFKYDESTRLIRFPGFEPFVYPAVGYPGKCHQCDQMPCCSPLRDQFYSGLRDSSVSLQHHLYELELALNLTTESLGWS
jgi:hypothetical protein